MRPLLLALLPFPLFAQSAPATAAAASAAESPAPERFQWVGKIAPGKKLVVRNDHGDIRARFGGHEGKVEVAAVLQQLSGGRPPLAVEMREREDALLITTGYPGGEAPAAGARDRADLVVFVPEGTPLEAQTGAGAIEIKGVRGDATARSATGDISLRAAGRLEARSERGAITAFPDPVERRPQRLETLTGDITVTLRDSADASVTAETSGEISTDFSLKLERHPEREPDKRATVKIGRGRALLRLASKRGRIRILWMAAAPGGAGADSD